MKNELTPEEKEKRIKTNKKIFKVFGGIIGIFILIAIFAPSQDAVNLKHPSFYPLKTTDIAKVRSGILTILNGKQPYKNYAPSAARDVRQLSDSVFTGSFPVVLAGSTKDDTYKMKFIIHKRDGRLGFTSSTDLDDSTVNETVMSSWARTMQDYIDGNS